MKLTLQEGIFEGTPEEAAYVVLRLRQAEEFDRVKDSLKEEVRRKKVQRVKRRMNRILSSYYKHKKCAEAEVVQQASYVPKGEFPIVANVDVHIVESVMRNAAKNGTTLSFLNDGYVLGVESQSAWRRLCEEIAMRGKQIADAIGYVPVCEASGNDMWIKFRKVS